MSEQPSAVAEAGNPPVEAASQATPPSSTPGGAAKKKKNKKKKKAGSIAAAATATDPSPSDTPRATSPVEDNIPEPKDSQTSVAHVSEPIGLTAPSEAEVVPVKASPVSAAPAEPEHLQASIEPQLAVAEVKKSVEIAPSTDLPPPSSITAAPTTELQPDFGAHSTSSTASHQPVPGVPAPMPPHASSLFADDAEQAAFEFSTNPVEEWSVENPADPDHPLAFEAPVEPPAASAPSGSQGGVAPEAPLADQPSFVDDPVAEATFDSTAELDSAIAVAGTEHEQEETQAPTTSSHPAALFSGEDAAFDIGGGDDYVPVPEEVPEGGSAAVAAAFDIPIPASHSATAPSTQLPIDAPSRPAAEPTPAQPAAEPTRAEPVVPSALALFSEEVESIAFDIPTPLEALEGEGDETTDPAAHVPKPLPPGAAALFADEAENEAFDIGQPDIDPPVSSEKPEHATSIPALSAQALFADDDSGVFDIAFSASEAPSDTAPTTSQAAAASMAASALFSDDTAEFDIGGHQEQHQRTAAQSRFDRAAPQQPADSLNMSTSTSDWMVDTSFDDSFDLGRKDLPPASPPMPVDITTPGVAEPADFEVPEGWYDETNTFQWYTPEQREAVREQMLSDLGYSQPAHTQSDHQSAAPPTQSAAAPTQSADPYAPAPVAPAPSNPYAPAVLSPPTHAADLYAPSVPVSNPYAPAPTANAYGQLQQSGYPSQVAAPNNGLYTPGFQPAASFTAAAASYNTPGYSASYAAQSYAVNPAPYDSYAPQPDHTTGYGPGPSQKTASPQKIEPPKRVKSTAYDPPFLSAQKRRTSSAAPATVAAPFQLPSDAPPMPNQVASPLAPPPGPKRAHTEQPVQMAAESYPGGSPYQQSAVLSDQTAHPSPYDPPAPTGMGFQSTGYDAPQRALSPSFQPPQRPATASATHPPKPVSFDPPMRQTSSRPPSRHSSRPDFAPPPITSAFANAPPVPPVPAEYTSPTGTHQQAPPAFAPPPKTRPKAFSPPPPPGKALSPPPPPTKVSSPPPPTTKAMTPPVGHRAPSRTASPAFAAPLKSSTPPPRPPSTTRFSSPGAPPRVSSPLRNETANRSSLGQAAVALEPPHRQMQSLGLEDEVAAESGAWDEEDGADWNPPAPGPPPRHSEGYERSPIKPPSPVKSGPPTSAYEPGTGGHQATSPTKQQRQPYESSEPASGYEPTPYQPPQPAASDPYSAEPFTTGAQQKEPSLSQYQSMPAPSTEYNPYGTTPEHQRQAAAEYNPFGPSIPEKVPTAEYNLHESAPQQAPSEYNPYKPSSPQKAAPPPAEYNPYGPSSPQKSTQQTAEYNPYDAPARRSSEYGRSSFEQARPSHERNFSQTNAYAPSAPAPSSQSAEYNPYATAPEQHRQSAELNPWNSTVSPQMLGNPSLPQPRQPSFSRSSGHQAPYDPYAPRGSLDAHRGMSPTQDMGVTPPPNAFFQSMNADPTYVPQQVLEQRPVSEDPLGRCTAAARDVPIAMFGFGGYLITALPGSGAGSPDAPQYGYGSYRGLVNIRPVSEVIESSAISTNETPFPGPLIFNPSIPKGAAGEKKKRESVLSYLAARTEEIERGLPYLKSSASSARREEEAKLTIVRILTALVEGDGRLFGTPKAEAAVRAALQPPAASANVAPTINGLGARPAPSGGRATAEQAAELSTMIMAGDKREAAQYAASAGLWSHALVISSSVDPELWREIVTRFAAAELADSPQTAGLRAAYTVYAGLTPANVDELFKAAHITDDPSADQWRDVVAAVLFNGKPTDLMSLDDLGSRFKRAGLHSVAHVCSLLSPNSPFSDLSGGASDRPILLIENEQDEDGVIFAEIAEYARSLVPTPKGAETPNPCLAQLLPYKLQRAWRAAELGNMEQARQYCEAVGTASVPREKGRKSSLPPLIAAALEDLLERLTGEPSVNPSNGLRTVGVRKAKSATLGKWFEGRLTKFIAGDDEEEESSKPAAKVASDTNIPVGPFSHFSTISPSPAQSSNVSRSVSTNDFGSSAPSTAGLTSYEPYGGGSGYQPWGGNDDDPSDVTPHGEPAVPTVSLDDGEFINPMGNLAFGVPAPATDYKPPSKPAVVDDDEDDLGFGNKALSRGRTPKVPEPAEDPYKPAPKVDTKPETLKEDQPSSSKPSAKGSFFGRLWGGKKEPETPKAENAPGYTRANLGEESSMVFDPELKRWVVKGQKAAPAAAAPPPPPPGRAQTASPAHTAGPTPPASRANTTTPSGGPPGSSIPPMSGLPPRSGARPPTATPPTGTPSTTPGGTPGGPPKSVAPSLDDLLSRPPSGRPTSAATKKKRAAAKYVDVFQQ